MSKENVFFHKGLSFDSRSAIQQAGYLKTARNINFDIDGNQAMRTKVSKMNTNVLAASVHSVKRFRNIVVAGYGTYLGFRSATADGDFTQIGASFANARWWWREYKDFLHGVNGTDQVLIDSSGNSYPGSAANPTTAPSGTSGAAGNPSGHYYLYVSYLITFPNGHTYETGLSAASSDVNVSSQKIEWSSIPVCPYTKYQGSTPIIHRKLYRGPGSGGTIGDIYYLATITDNSTTVYSDNVSDATLANQDASYVDEYGPMGATHYIEYHYGRLFAINNTYPNRLYWADAAGGTSETSNEIIFPIATPSTNWDDIRVAGFDEQVDPMGLQAYGSNLYIPLKHTWIQKYGNDPDTWSYKKTWATNGVGAPYTIDVCSNPSGIIALTYPSGGHCGLAIFNGQTSEMFTSPRLDYVFDTHLDQTKIAYCRGRMVGSCYHLLYPSTSATGNDPDTHLVIDLRRWPDFRVSNWTDISAACLDSYKGSNKFYFGCTDKYVRWNKTSTAESITIDVETHESIGGSADLANINKTLRQLKYNLDLGDDETVRLYIYVDGSAITWPDGNTYASITGTGDLTQVLQSLPNNIQGYYFRLRIYASTAITAFNLYSPWVVEFD